MRPTGAAFTAIWNEGQKMARGIRSYMEGKHGNVKEIREQYFVWVRLLCAVFSTNKYLIFDQARIKKMPTRSSRLAVCKEGTFWCWFLLG